MASSVAQGLSVAAPRAQARAGSAKAIGGVSGKALRSTSFGGKVCSLEKGVKWIDLHVLKAMSFIGGHVTALSALARTGCESFHGSRFQPRDAGLPICVNRGAENQ